MNKKHQKNKITLIITVISAILMASLFTVGNQLTSNALAQTITNQSDVAIIETQTANISTMGNKIKNPITEINNTEIGRATPTTDSINKIK